MASSSSDWSATQYLRFGNERTRAVDDLVSRVPLPGGMLPAAPSAAAPLRIIDLGCGPGNSTQVLVRRFPGARVSGVDSSPNMIEKARATLSSEGSAAVDFALADLRTYEPPTDPPVDLLLANAVFQWLRLPDRISTQLRLLSSLRSGGVLAYQVPDNKEEPSHRSMRDVAQGLAPGTAGGPWVPLLRDLSDRDPIETPETLYDALAPHCSSVDIWHGVYYHVLPGGVADIVEWVKGTGLRPFLNALPEGPVRDAYIAAYQTRLADFYKPQFDGSVLIRYPRLFVVAVKK